MKKPAGRRPRPGEARGAAALAVATDVGEPEAAEALAAATIERFGGIDVLVNNAGIGDGAPVGEETPEGWERVMRTNLTGAFLAARAALPSLVERHGSVVGVSSINGERAGPGWAAYSTSKAGLIMLTRSLANDYGPQGVRANCVLPGWVRTPMGDADMDDVARLRGIDREDAYRLTHRLNPLRRPAEAERGRGCRRLPRRARCLLRERRGDPGRRRHQRRRSDRGGRVQPLRGGG